MRLLASFTTIAILLAVGGCSGGGSGSPSPTPPPTAPSTPALEPADEAQGMCAATAVQVTPSIDAADIVEASGLAASRVNPDVLWVHNDSGDSARFFAIGLDGRLRATYDLPGAEAIDWEDIAVGPGPQPGVSYVYLGDIGDNGSKRQSITVYRVPEPQVPADAAAEPITLTDVERFELHYPDHAHDAETLLVDPRTGDLLVVTKDLSGTSLIYTAAAPLGGRAPLQLQAAGQILFLKLTSHVQLPTDAPPLTHAGFLATGGDISADGALIAIRTYSTIWVWTRQPGESVAAALAVAPCEAPSALEKQGESIAFGADGREYYTTSEGTRPPLHAFNIAAR